MGYYINRLNISVLTKLFLSHGVHFCPGLIKICFSLFFIYSVLLIIFKHIM